MSNKDFNAKVTFTVTEGKNNGEQYHINSKVEGQTGYLVIGLADVLADILAGFSRKDADNLLLKFMITANRLTEEVRNENEANSTN